MNRYNNPLFGQKPPQQPLPPKTPFSLIIARPAVRASLQDAIKKDFWPPQINPESSTTKTNKKNDAEKKDISPPKKLSE